MTAKELKQEYLNFRQKVIDYYTALPKGIYKFPQDYWVNYLQFNYECQKLVKTKKGIYIDVLDEEGLKERFNFYKLTAEQLMYIAQIIEDDIQNRGQKNNFE